MSDCRKQKWRGIGGHHRVGWGPRVVPAWVSWHYHSSSAKTHRRKEGRRIEERHGWMVMYGRGGGIRLAKWRWRAAERGYCQGEALLESLWASVSLRLKTGSVRLKTRSCATDGYRWWFCFHNHQNHSKKFKVPSLTTKYAAEWSQGIRQC